MCIEKSFAMIIGGTELSIGWNSTKFGNLLLKGQFINFQCKIYKQFGKFTDLNLLRYSVLTLQYAGKFLFCVLSLDNMTVNLPTPSAYTAQYAIHNTPKTSQLPDIEIFHI
jgi:hypothetical protein